MNIFALDTALGACSVAVGTELGIQAARFELRQRGHAEVIMDMIDHVCDTAGMTLRDMDVFVTTTGPGTFTGVRIGLSVARGLALSLDRMLLGFSTLETLAWGALQHLISPAGGSRLFVVHDARRGEIYGQMFRVTGGKINQKRGLKELMPPVVMTLKQAGEHISADTTADVVFLVGSGTRLVAEMAGNTANWVECPPVPVNPDARTLVVMAAQEVNLRGDKPFGHYRDGQPVAPLYLRAPDARLPGKAAL